MGNFYVNLHLRDANGEAVETWCRSLKRDAFIFYGTARGTVIFDRAADMQNEYEILDLGKITSREFPGPVFCVLNHDDDILCYWLFESGEIVDQYNSYPGYFSDGNSVPSGGNASLICSRFGVSEKERDVEAILRSQEYVFAIERHEHLARLLNQPWPHVSLGYRYIHEGNLTDGTRAEEFIQCTG